MPETLKLADDIAKAAIQGKDALMECLDNNRKKPEFIEELRNAALIVIDKRYYDLACDLYENLISEDIELWIKMEAMHNIGYCLDQQKCYKDSIAAYSKVITIGSCDEGSHGEGRASYTNALRARGMIRKDELKDLDGAISDFEILAATIQEHEFENLTDTLLTLSQMYLDASDFQKIWETNKKVLKIDPFNNDAIRFMITAAAKLDKASRLVDILTDIAEQYNDAQGWFNLGRVEAVLNTPFPFYMHFKRAVELDPENLDALFCEGLGFERFGLLEKAKELYRKFLKKTSEYDIDREWVVRHIDNINRTLESKHEAGSNKHINNGQLPDDINKIKVRQRRIYSL